MGGFDDQVCAPEVSHRSSRLRVPASCLAPDTRYGDLPAIDLARVYCMASLGRRPTPEVEDRLDIDPGSIPQIGRVDIRSGTVGRWGRTVGGRSCGRTVVGWSMVGRSIRPQTWEDDKGAGSGTLSRRPRFLRASSFSAWGARGFCIEERTKEWSRAGRQQASRPLLTPTFATLASS